MATRNRYAEIMAQYAQSQPFSFTGIPSSYYGGQSGYTGGYDATAYTPAAAPVNRYADIMAQPAMGGGGGRGMPADEGGTFTEPTSEQAYNVSQFGRNIRYVSPLTGLLSTAFGNYLAGQVNPNYSNEGRNYPAPTGGFLSSEAAQGDASNYSNEGRSGGGGGGGYSGAPSGGSDVGRSAPGSAHYAQGGHVSMQHLLGPDPEGPDDGYASLKDGEFVINDKAVKKYGIELMQAINSGKISKGKLRGLLEM